MDSTYIGATVGRVANRIGGAQFKLNGTHYKLAANEGKNMLHGKLFLQVALDEYILLIDFPLAKKWASSNFDRILKSIIFIGGSPGFSDVVWKVQRHKNDGQAPHIVFAYHSIDGEQGM